MKNFFQYHHFATPLYHFTTPLPRHFTTCHSPQGATNSTCHSVTCHSVTCHFTTLTLWFGVGGGGSQFFRKGFFQKIQQLNFSRKTFKLPNFTWKTFSKLRKKSFSQAFKLLKLSNISCKTIGSWKFLHAHVWQLKKKSQKFGKTFSCKVWQLKSLAVDIFLENPRQ